MSGSLDLRQFYQTFFEEAEELLAEMERLLLELDAQAPDAEQLNAIFRAAHSIKGGAGTFGFTALTQTTHLLENLLDAIRHGEMVLRPDMIDIFLETKDVLTGQLEIYRRDAEPSPDSYARICAVLQQLAQEHLDARRAGDAPAAAAAAGASPGPALPVGDAPMPGAGQAMADVAAPGAPPAGEPARLRVRLSGLAARDRDNLLDELAHLGRIEARQDTGKDLTLWLDTSCEPDDVVAVCCFVIDLHQIEVTREPAAAFPPPEVAAAPAAEAQPVSAGPPGAPAVIDEAPVARAAVTAAPGGEKEAGSIRVAVEKVDQIINLVGELVITQAMLAQTASTLDPVLHDRLLNGMEQLERNARDLQESVMGIRMMPMDYVFSRFPRLVRDLAGKLGKQVELVTFGRATELDKSLIERIIDPLTHLVRNSLDHGIETPAQRAAVGKPALGQVVLSAQHSGGNIVIEVSDDGAGLDRARILAKAQRLGLPITDAASDDEVWQLIFAPGFSTAAQVTDVSGRGVGMDVVKRNIQGMGGHVQLSSRPGEGTTTRIVLPLTLAILDGMSVRVGDEVFILPLNHVTESLQPRLDHIHTVAGEERVMQVRGEYLPLIELHRVFQVPGAQADPVRAIAVIMQAEERRFALLVDHLVGQHQVVVKSLEANYRKVYGVSAATILGDGSVALIVDVFALARAGRDRLGQLEAVL